MSAPPPNDSPTYTSQNLPPLVADVDEQPVYIRHQWRGLPEPKALESWSKFKERFAIWAVIGFVAILVLSWLGSGVGIPPLWLMLFLTVIFGMIAFAFWLVFSVVMPEWRHQRNRVETLELMQHGNTHQYALRELDGSITIHTERIRADAPVRVQRQIRKGNVAVAKYGYRSQQAVEENLTKRQQMDHDLRDRERDVEERLHENDRQSTDRNAELDRRLKYGLTKLEGNQRLELEMAQQITEMLFLIRELETENLDSELTRIIDSVEGFRPAMERILEVSDDNPHAARNLMVMLSSTLSTGFNTLIGAYTQQAFRGRTSRRTRRSNDQVQR